jgi:hypothetical protein
MHAHHSCDQPTPVSCLRSICVLACVPLISAKIWVTDAPRLSTWPNLGHASAPCVCVHAWELDLPIPYSQAGSCMRTTCVLACMGLRSANTWSCLHITFSICQDFGPCTRITICQHLCHACMHLMCTCMHVARSPAPFTRPPSCCTCHSFRPEAVPVRLVWCVSRPAGPKHKARRQCGLHRHNRCESQSRV